MNKFLLIGRGINQGWWLLVETPELFATIQKSVTAGLFLKFLHNPHFEQCYPGQSATALAAKWTQMAEKYFGFYKKIIVNQNGGMVGLVGVDKLDIVEVFETETLAYPENKIASRRITISRWYGGQHWYLQCAEKVIFSAEKFNTFDDAMREARKYALEERIHVADSYEYDQFYTRDGD